MPAEPGPVLPEGADVDERLGAFKSLCMRLDKHSELLSGLDGALTPVLAAQFAVGAGLHGALAALTPVPADLAAGYQDALAFSHHMLAGVTWGGVGKAFVHQVSQGFPPGAGAPGPGAAFSAWLPVAARWLSRKDAECRDQSADRNAPDQLRPLGR